MAFTEDMTVFFNTGGFAVDATWTLAGGGSGPYTIQVIFENEFEEYPLGEAGHAGRAPMALVADTQIAQGAGMKRGDTLLIDGNTYKVAQVEPDGTGLSRIRLRT